MEQKGYPIRVLHVLGALNIGGAEMMVMNLYRNIDREKIQFDFVIHTTAQGDFTNEILKLGGRIYSCPRYIGRNHIQYCKWWNNFLEEHREYKIIHGHVRSTASLYMAIAKKKGCVTISHSHSTSNGEGISALAKNAMQYPIRYMADYMFACSDEAGEWLFGRKACTEKKYFFFPNAIELSRFQYSESVRKEMRGDLDIEREMIIGTVGRNSNPKNPFGILDIFERVSKKNEKAVLLWIGTGELEGEVKKEAVRRKLANRIHFMGNRKDVPELMQTFDIFIFPSLWEGLPVTVIEAQAAGLPCLISDRVTKQVAVSKLVHYLPVDQGYEVWEEAILNSNLDRQDVQNEIRQAGFDIHESAQWLEKFYLKTNK